VASGSASTTRIAGEDRDETSAAISKRVGLQLTMLSLLAARIFRIISIILCKQKLGPYNSTLTSIAIASEGCDIICAHQRELHSGQTKIKILTREEKMPMILSMFIVNQLNNKHT